MTKKEIYAWASLGFAGAVLCYYLIVAIGLSDTMPEFTQSLKGILWKVIVAAFIVELILDGLRSLNSKAIHEDERDRLIEARASQNGYYFLIGAVVLLLVHLITAEGVANLGWMMIGSGIPYFSIHFMVVSLFVAMMIKSGTQLYYYHTS